jgi:hypothetical protein
MTARQPSVNLCRQIIGIETQACKLRLGPECAGANAAGKRDCSQRYPVIPITPPFMAAAIAVKPLISEFGGYCNTSTINVRRWRTQLALGIVGKCGCPNKSAGKLLNEAISWKKSAWSYQTHITLSRAACQSVALAIGRSSFETEINIDDRPRSLLTFAQRSAGTPIGGRQQKMPGADGAPSPALEIFSIAGAALLCRSVDAITLGTRIVREHRLPSEDRRAS